MPSSIHPATADDIQHVSAILTEAAQWLAQSGQVMWRDSELLPERLAADVSAGLFFLAEPIWFGNIPFPAIHIVSMAKTGSR